MVEVARSVVEVGMVPGSVVMGGDDEDSTIPIGVVGEDENEEPVRAGKGVDDVRCVDKVAGVGEEREVGVGGVGVRTWMI